MWGGARQSDPLWGAVTSCGTEGNLLGILYGRTFCEAATPDVTPTLVSSVESHYSVPKAARMYRMPYERIASSDIDGANAQNNGHFTVCFAAICRCYKAPPKSCSQLAS